MLKSGYTFEKYSVALPYKEVCQTGLVANETGALCVLTYAYSIPEIFLSLKCHYRSCALFVEAPSVGSLLGTGLRFPWTLYMLYVMISDPYQYSVC